MIELVSEMQRRSDVLRTSGKTLALVPTMGFLHEGHVGLMKAAKRLADQVVLSIFVNPAQFGPNEDFERYPRDMEGDLSKAEKNGVDLVFLPSIDDIYPSGFQTVVSVTQVAKLLCGLSRPGHFDGVTTVVAKLFHIAKPHFAVFGQKDYQQLTVVGRMVKDLNMDIRLVGIPTVREPDGLAMSSRNSYLGPAERRSALCLWKSLELAKKIVAQGERRSHRIKSAIEDLIHSHPRTEIDYVNICHPDTLEDVEAIEGEVLLALAVRVGGTRLIDNALINGNAGKTPVADQNGKG